MGLYGVTALRQTFDGEGSSETGSLHGGWVSMFVIVNLTLAGPVVAGRGCFPCSLQSQRQGGVVLCTFNNTHEMKMGPTDELSSAGDLAGDPNDITGDLGRLVPLQLPSTGANSAHNQPHDALQRRPVSPRRWQLPDRTLPSSTSGDYQTPERVLPDL